MKAVKDEIFELLMQAAQKCKEAGLHDELRTIKIKVLRKYHTSKQTEIGTRLPEPPKPRSNKMPLYKPFDPKAYMKQLQQVESAEPVQAMPKAAEAPAPAKPEADQAEKPEPAAKVEERKIAQTDLKIIEGIGPSKMRKLNRAGIRTFKDMLEADLSQHGDPGSWKEQAQLAFEGKWDELDALKDKLKGGKW